MSSHHEHPESTRPDFSKGFPSEIKVFESLPDPRNGAPATRHYFGEVLFIALAAMLCGMDSCEDFVRFSKVKKDWLKSRLQLPGGLPSANTYLRIFAAIDPNEFYQCLRNFSQTLAPKLADQHVAIDGKALRGSRKSGASTVQMVSACLAESGFTLAQESVDSKSNEITAIPEIIAQLDLSAAIVSIDAIGTQREIAKQLKDFGADYFLALKGNQETIHHQTIAAFEKANISLENPAQSHTTVNKGHGRIERRTATVLASKDYLSQEVAKLWKGLRTLVRIESETLLSEGKSRRETRYYLNSKESDAKEALRYSRSHWGIENRCHWVLDVVFKEDACRARTGHAAANLSTLRRITLNILKLDKKHLKEALRGRRLYALMDNSYLESLMGIS